MPHKVIKKTEVQRVEEEIARIRKAIDRVRIYGQAKDNESVKQALNEVKKLRQAIVDQKNAALDEAMNVSQNGLTGQTNKGEAQKDRALIYRGYELGLSFLIDAFENTEEEIKHYHERRKHLESQLKRFRQIEQR